MTDFENSRDKEDVDREGQTIALDELEHMEHEHDHDDPCYNESDWGESYDDLDSEAWEKQYRKDSEPDEIHKDPWELE